MSAPPQRCHVSLHRGPDCSVGKHTACSGDAWCVVFDSPADCRCQCHTEPPSPSGAGSSTSERTTMSETSPEATPDVDEAPAVAAPDTTEATEATEATDDDAAETGE